MSEHHATKSEIIGHDSTQQESTKITSGEDGTSDLDDSHFSLSQSQSSGLAVANLMESCASLDFSLGASQTIHECARSPSTVGTPHPRARRPKAGELPPMSPPFRKRSSMTSSLVASPAFKSPRASLTRPTRSPSGKLKGILRRGVFHSRRSGSPCESPVLLVRGKVVKFNLPNDGLTSLSNSFAEDDSIDLLDDSQDDNYFKRSNSDSIARMAVPTLESLKAKNDTCAEVKNSPKYREFCSSFAGESINDLSAGGGLDVLLSPDAMEESSSSVGFSCSTDKVVPPFDPNGSCAFTYGVFELSDTSSESPTAASAFPDPINEERPKTGDVDLPVPKIDSDNPVESVREDIGAKLNLLAAR